MTASLALKEIVIVFIAVVLAEVCVQKLKTAGYV